MKISAECFLRVVGFIYVIIGAAGLAASLLPSMGLLYVCGLSAMTFLVTPPGLVLEYGIQASCFEQPRGAWGCNLDADVIQHARTVIMALCVMSVVGGLSGIWAASTKDKQAGRAVWLALIVVSLGVAFWNLSGWFSDARRINTFAAPVPSAFWALAYATAYFRWLRKGAD